MPDILEQSMEGTVIGTLVGIGIGPGDPELVSVKASKVLAQADVIALPESAQDRESVVYNAVMAYARKDVTLVSLSFPMITDIEIKTRLRRENAEKIATFVRQGLIVVFVTLGDPMLYSTYIYLIDHLREWNIPFSTIPGITSFCAAASLADFPLAIQDESVLIVPVTTKTDFAVALDSADTVVFMKASSDPARLAQELRSRASRIEVLIASRAGLTGQWFSTDIETLTGSLPYLTTVLVKRKKGVLA